jgi:uncharacterized damage-inducible protein DinB
MAIKDGLLPEFDHEMAGARKTLERVPDDKFDWKPHEKSSAMGALATHIAGLAGWATFTISQDSLDIAPNGEPQRTTPLTSQAELLEKFDQNVAASRDAIAAASDEVLFQPWTLLANGKVLMTMPRVAVLRSFVLNHLIHHRAQLGVYLRLNDIPVPSIYGPSADDSGGFSD